MLRQIETVSTTQAIVEQLISLIKTGTLKPGDKLPSENELMERLGVGRSSIREAKQTLMAMGLIRAHPGRGSFVKEISPDAAINADVVSMLLAGEHVWALHEARELLEVQIAGLAAQRATEDDLAAIESALHKLEDAVATGQSVYDPGIEFHFALVKAAHNPVLVNLYHPIMGLLQEYQRPIYEEYSDAQAEIEQHRDIFESVRRGDGKLAQETMRKHLGYVISTTKQAIPEAFARE